MAGTRQRQIVIFIAAVGLFVSVIRLEILAQPASPPGAPQTPAARLADEMEVFELSLTQGSQLSLGAFQSVEDSCHAQQSNQQITRACTLFESGAHHAWDHHDIDAAIHLLRGG